MADGYSLPPVSPGGFPVSMPGTTPGSNWATMIQQSQARPAATPTSNDPLLASVYLGTGVRGLVDQTPQGFGSAESAPTPAAPAETTIERLLEDFERMDRREQRQLALLLTIGGYGSSVSLEDAGKASRDMTLNETLNAYLELLDDAAGRYARGQKITPEQLLEQNVAYRLPRGAEWDGSYGDLVDILHENDIPLEDEDLSGTHTVTSTNTEVTRDIMDPNDAMALTRSLLQRELGRDPTKAEFEDFIGAVQAAQRANPTRTTSKSTRTITTDSDGDTIGDDSSSSSTTHEGIGSAGLGDLMLRRARQNPDWAEWQAVGTYAPALFQALGATVPGV